MAITIPCATSRVVGIDEYIEHIETNVDLRDFDSIASSAHMLKALANDRALIVRELNNLVVNPGVLAASPSAQTIILGQGTGFYVRANIWPASADMANGRAYQNQIAYNIAHDHNFTFLTVGHLGLGYETEIYEYDYETVSGYTGEIVNLRFLEKAKLIPGVAMLYRASRDVHVQYPPEELSITVNLMVLGPSHEQFQFDLANRTISGVVDPHAAGRMTLLKLAGMIGDEESYLRLETVASTHTCRQTRLAAYEAMCRQRPHLANTIWEQAARDAAPLVRRAAIRNLNPSGK